MLTSHQNLLETIKQTCDWFESYGIVTHLAQSINAKNIIEIGVAYDYHAEYICRSLPNIQYTNVDPYLAGYDDDDIFSRDVQKLFQENSAQDALDRLFETVVTNLEKFQGRASLIREKSWLAASFF